MIRYVLTLFFGATTGWAAHLYYVYPSLDTTTPIGVIAACVGFNFAAFLFLAINRSLERRTAHAVP